MKVSDQNGGGECVLMKIKSAEKKTHTKFKPCFCMFLFTWPSSCAFALPKSKIIDMPVVSQHFKPCLSLIEPIGSMNGICTVR